MRANAGAFLVLAAAVTVIAAPLPKAQTLTPGSLAGLDARLGADIQEAAALEKRVPVPIFDSSQSAEAKAEGGAGGAGGAVKADTKNSNKGENKGETTGTNTGTNTGGNQSMTGPSTNVSGGNNSGGNNSGGNNSIGDITSNSKGGKGGQGGQGGDGGNSNSQATNTNTNNINTQPAININNYGGPSYGGRRRPRPQLPTNPSERWQVQGQDWQVEQWKQQQRQQQQ